MLIIGLSVETTNENSKSIIDIGNLWTTFYQNNIIEKIPNKIDYNIYAIYTDYENNYMGKYTTIIGMQVSSLDTIPEGMIGRNFPDQNFKQFTAKGNIPEAVADTWRNIWNQDNTLNRSYMYDFEVYGEKSQNGIDSEVDIFIGVK